MEGIDMRKSFVLIALLVAAVLAWQAAPSLAAGWTFSGTATLTQATDNQITSLAAIRSRFA